MEENSKRVFTALEKEQSSWFKPLSPPPKLGHEASAYEAESTEYEGGRTAVVIVRQGRLLVVISVLGVGKEGITDQSVGLAGQVLAKAGSRQ